MKPYYQDDSCTIYHGDCLDVMPRVTADVLITDPPYGVDFAGKATKHTVATGGYTTHDDADVGPVAVAVALDVCERGAVFPGIRGMFQYPTPRDVGCVYCPSGAGNGPWGFCCFHPVMFYGKRIGIGSRPTSITSFEKSPDLGHPCPKPIGWMTWITSLVSREGEAILDPFMGSGTTLRAAKDLGRKAIGIEIEERYCEIAAKRLAQEVLDFGGVA